MCIGSVSSEDDNPNEGADATKQSKQSFSSPTVPTTIKFALPEATQDEIVKSEGQFKLLNPAQMNN